jgi:hypothetical protein
MPVPMVPVDFYGRIRPLLPTKSATVNPGKSGKDHSGPEGADLQGPGAVLPKNLWMISPD